MMNIPLRYWFLLLCFISTAPVSAQPPAPPPPTKFKVSLRYAIHAPRDQHVLQYDSLIRHLKKLDFEFDPPLEKHLDSDREDRTKTFLHGAIASGKARKILDHPVVQSILLIPLEPNEFTLPEELNDPVMVRLELPGGLNQERQRELINQTRVLLRELGFKEPVGYDHRGYTRRAYTRIVGTIPRGKLDLLQRDLRNHPAGWVGPVIPREEIPSPLRVTNPVQVIEVLPDDKAIKELSDPEPRVPEFLEKISAELWELVKEKEVEPRLVRVQIGFVGRLAQDGEWKFNLKDLAPGFFEESQLGQYVTGIMRLDQVKTLAASPIISVIRLPRVPYVHVDPAIKIKGDNAKVLQQTGLADFHKRGHQGKGTRIVILDRDFRGWEALVQKKQLPAKTRLIDLTAELSPEIDPLPSVAEENQLGHGTLCAQAAAIAAPEAEISLVRSDIRDPYQLHEIVRYIQTGRPSNHIEQRNGELVGRRTLLFARRTVLLDERRAILNDFRDETDLRERLEFLGPVFGWLYSDREWHRARMQDHEKLEAEQLQRERRLRQLLKDIDSLKDVPIVVNSLAWNQGYPLGAISPLSRALDDPQKGPLWFQAVGNHRGQCWLGYYRHTPGDPAMKFVDDSAPLPKGRWSNEINFLAWQPYLGEAKPDLPEKAKLRITMQWREPHDPEYYLGAEEGDLYRRPLAQIRLQLVRQRDPEVKKLPGDMFEIVARTSGLPERLEHLPGGSIYEHVLEVPLDNAGRYAIRLDKQIDTQWALVPHPIRKSPTFQLLEGLAPTGIRPLGVTTLPALEKNWELRPRIFIEVIDERNRLQGRVVFMDFPTEAGVIGSPADARNVISVGAASLQNRPQPYSAFGTPSLMELAPRPWLYAYDELELAGGGAFGTSIANAFAAGITATLLDSGMSRAQVLQALRAQEGQVLRVPPPKKK